MMAMCWKEIYPVSHSEFGADGGTFLYRRANGVFIATKQWYFCCDIKWCFKCDVMFLLFQYLRSYFLFLPSF